MKRYFFLLALLMPDVHLHSQCLPGTAGDTLNVNNVKALIPNNGGLWFRSGQSLYEVPGGSGNAVLGAAALWIGGLDQNNQLRIAAQTYGQTGSDFFPGPLDPDGNVSTAVCQQYNRMWNVYGSEITEVIQTWNATNPGGLTIPIPVGQIPLNVLQWPGNGNPFSVVPGANLAPFYDRNGDGIYNATLGDYPILGSNGSPVFADQMIYWVFNDNGNVHTETNGLPLGVEIHAIAYAFQSADAVNDATFYRYKIINRSSNAYHDFYAAFWLDPDMGLYIDDFIGCDTTRNMAIIYTPYDSTTGVYPPIAGIKVLDGISNDPVQNPMSRFVYYNNDFTVTGNPQNASHFYSYLTGKWKNGTPFTQGGTGYGGNVPTNYVFPGEPGGSDWSECGDTIYMAADRRILVVSGPISLDPGGVATIDYAAIYAMPPPTAFTPCPTFTQIQNVADLVQSFYDVNIGPQFDATSVRPNSRSLTSSLIPNPASSTTHLHLPSGTIGQLEIFDLNGKSVRSHLVTGHLTTLDLKGLNGCYIVRFTDGQGHTVHEKLIVQP